MMTMMAMMLLAIAIVTTMMMMVMVMVIHGDDDEQGDDGFIYLAEPAPPAGFEASDMGGTLHFVPASIPNSFTKVCFRGS